jgi:putative ABC transport system permease protein
MSNWILRTATVSLRRLSARKRLAVAVVCLVAMPVGAAATIFSILDAVVLQAVPFPDAEALYLIKCKTSPDKPGGNCPVPVADAIRQQSRAVDELSYHSFGPARLTYGDSEPRIVPSRKVSSSFFSTLGIRPAAGRWFLKADNTAGQHLVVLSERTSRDLFVKGENPIGATVGVGGKPHAVIGVMPREFVFPDSRVGAWVLDPLNVERMEQTSLFDSAVIARLARGASREQLEGQLAALATRLPRTSDRDRTPTFEVQRLREAVLKGDFTMVWLLFIGTNCLLLVVVANLVNLFAASSIEAHDCQRIKLALGATRLRLRLEHCAEHAMLAIPAGILGVGAAAGALWILREAGGLSLPRSELASLNTRVLWYSGGLAAATVTISAMLGFVPTSNDLVRRSTGTVAQLPGVRALHRGSVVIQLTISTFLLLMAVSAIGLLSQIRNLPLGFEARHLVAINFDPVSEDDATLRAARSFHEALREDIGSLSGVEGVGTASFAPLGGASTVPALPIEEPRGWSAGPSAHVQIVSHGYFGLLRIALLAGRVFHQADSESAPCVAVANRALSNSFGGPEAAIGRVISANGYTGRRAQRCLVIGTVENSRDWSAREDAGPQVYLSAAQHLDRNRTLLVRTRQGTSIAPAVRAVAQRRDVTQSIGSVFGVWEFVEGATQRERALAYQVLLFAVCAIGVASLGLFAMAQYIVRTRRTEIGIRTALGAKRLGTVALVIREHVLASGVALSVGVALYVLATQKYAVVSETLPPIGAVGISLAALSSYLLFVLILAWPIAAVQTKEVWDLLRSE